jgi:hypothetical protein
MPEIEPKALTVGEITRQLKYPIHRVEYVIRSRSLRPHQRAGNARVFTESDFQFIRSALCKMDAEREGSAA